MVDFIGSHVRKIPDDMTLRAERELHGKTWRFDLQVPQAHWEDLFHWNAPDTITRNAWDAYQHAKAFWDYLTERNADELGKTAKAGAAIRRQLSVVQSLEWLEAEYQRFKTAAGET